MTGCAFSGAMTSAVKPLDVEEAPSETAGCGRGSKYWAVYGLLGFWEGAIHDRIARCGGRHRT